MLDEPSHTQVFADRGGYAAGRDLHVVHHCPARICPSCEVRWVTDDHRVCNHCQNEARAVRLQLDGAMALGGFVVCTMIGLWLADLIGYGERWSLALVLAVLLWGAGYYTWIRLQIWAECDAGRQLRALWGWLRGLRR